MKAALNSVIEELKRLQSEGVTHLNVSNEAVQKLKSTTQGYRPKKESEKEEADRVIASIPENIRSASVKEFDQILKEEAAPKPASSKVRKPSFDAPPRIDLPSGDKETRWKALRKIVLECPVCNEQVREGYKVVFGVGNIDADIFFCGEAPGAEEEEQGEPFVGKAGQLLNRMIRGMGLERNQVYIGNIMNWRPQLPTRVGNRPPTKEEMDFCLPYLRAQVEVVSPKVIVALGATATKGLLGSNAFRSLREVKGTWQSFEGIPVLPTYHPSYLLRNDTKKDKRAAWEDLLKVMERCEMPISEKQRNYFL